MFLVSLIITIFSQRAQNNKNIFSELNLNFCSANQWVPVTLSKNQLWVLLNHGAALRALHTLAAIVPVCYNVMVLTTTAIGTEIGQTISLKLRQTVLPIKTRTKDNVFVTLEVNVQWATIQGGQLL